jgi:hypothetical protein
MEIMQFPAIHGRENRHRPKTGEFGHFQLDTWQNSTSSLLMFEGMDLKCMALEQTHAQKTRPI